MAGGLAGAGSGACKAGWAGMVLPGGEVHPHFAAAIGDLAKCASVIGPLDLGAAGVPAGLPDAGRQAGVLTPELAGPRRAPVFMTAVRAAVQEEDHAAAAAVHAGQGTSRQARGLRAKILQAGRGCGTLPQRVVEIHREVSFCCLVARPWTSAS